MNDDLRRRWDAFAEDFEKHFERATLQVGRTLVAHGRLDSARQVLELGGGAGGLSLELLPRLHRDARLTCTDFSPEMVRRARQRLPEQVRVLEADAQALPFEEASFDRVFANMNLMIVPDTDAALSETARVLQPGGIYLFSVWGEPERSHQMRVLPELMEQMGLEMPTPPRSNFHLSDAAALRARLKAAGFDRVLTGNQVISLGLLSGQEYAAMMLENHPSVRQLVAELPPDTAESLRRALVQRVEQLMDAGSLVGLDCLFGVARRAS